MKCPKCGLENPDDFKYCHECGTYLAPKFDAYNHSKHQNSNFYNDSGFSTSNGDLMGVDSRKMILIGYAVAILFGWGGLILNLLLGSFGSFGFFTFVGFVYPGAMLNSSNPSVRKHGIIQMIIMFIGFIVSLYIMFKGFL